MTYVVARNINYTNVCHYRCRFCAFSKGKLSANLRGRPYDLDLGKFSGARSRRGNAERVEACLQGGIHPEYDGTTYLSICRAIKEVCPQIHIHAFSPLEVWQGAATSTRARVPDRARGCRTGIDARDRGRDPRR